MTLPFFITPHDTAGAPVTGGGLPPPPPPVIFLISLPHMASAADSARMAMSPMGKFLDFMECLLVKCKRPRGDGRSFFSSLVSHPSFVVSRPSRRASMPAVGKRVEIASDTAVVPRAVDVDIERCQRRRTAHAPCGVEKGYLRDRCGKGIAGRARVVIADGGKRRNCCRIGGEFPEPLDEPARRISPAPDRTREKADPFALIAYPPVAVPEIDHVLGGGPVIGEFHAREPGGRGLDPATPVVAGLDTVHPVVDEQVQVF